MQPWLDPLVVSWGWEAELPSGVSFIDYHEWQGTRDFAAFLAVPAAIQFQADHDWPRLQAECRALVRQARERLNALTGQPAFCPATDDWLGQMAAVALPLGTHPAGLPARLWNRHRIEVPCHLWNGLPLLRLSVQPDTRPGGAGARERARVRATRLGFCRANKGAPGGRRPT